jgi:hypothetical protein
MFRELDFLLGFAAGVIAASRAIDGDQATGSEPNATRAEDEIIDVEFDVVATD